MASRMCIKYLLFAFNILFWFLGGAFVCIAIWSKTEKGNLTNFNSIAADPATIMLIAGIVIFWLGFFGWVGALRENVLFLQIFSGSLIVLFLAEAGGGIAAFIMKENVRGVIEDQMYNAIHSYREDSDLRDAVNVAQRTFQCCGVKNFTDWQQNEYFKCCNEGIESCGVPYSCCNLTLQVNLFCGVKIMDVEEKTMEKTCELQSPYVPMDKLRDGYGGGHIIIQTGCLSAMESWFNTNLYYIGGAAIGVAIIQISGVMLSQSLTGKVKYGDP